MTDKKQIKTIIKQYADKGMNNFQKALKDDGKEAATTKYWDGFSDCANLLLLEIDSMQKESKECMYSKDNYTDEDRKILCNGCEEECEFNKKKEPVNECKIIPKPIEYYSTCEKCPYSKKSESVSEELEKAAIQFATDTETGKVDVVKQSSFFWGAIYHKQQMKAKAVEIAREETIDNVVEWLKKNATYTHPRKGTKECIVNIVKLKDDLKNK